MDNERLILLSKALDEAKKYIENGNEIPIEFQIFFPNGRKECELVYGGKESRESIVSKVIPVPLQEDRKFPINVEIKEGDKKEFNWSKQTSK